MDTSTDKEFFCLYNASMKKYAYYKHTKYKVHSDHCLAGVHVTKNFTMKALVENEKTAEKWLKKLNRVDYSIPGNRGAWKIRKVVLRPEFV